MEPNPPLTAKQAALLGAQADKPPFDPAADRRHVIASVIRRAGEAMGNSKQSAEAADAIQRGEAGSNQFQAQTAADWAAPVDSTATGDMSLARIVAADQAASRGFPPPPAAPDENDPPLPLGSPMDAPQTWSWMVGAFDAQADSVGSQPAFPEIAGVSDASMSPDIAQDSTPVAAPNAFPSLESFQSDASALEDFTAPMESTSLSDFSDFQYDRTNPGSITQLPYTQADESAGPRLQLLPKGTSFSDPTPAGDGYASITYLPRAGNPGAPDGGSAPRERRDFKVASSFADVNKDATVALLALKTALLKVIDEAGEQDRIDALHREASRRACL